MSVIVVLVIALLAVFVAVAIVYVPLRIMVDIMARKIAGPIRAFINRQRERRQAGRDTAERRH
jgi:hypothetical protein